MAAARSRRRTYRGRRDCLRAALEGTRTMKRAGIVAAALLTGCFLNDRFQGGSGGGDDMAIGVDDMTDTAGDMGPDSTDMSSAGGDMAMYVGMWKRYAMTSSPTTLQSPRFI